MSEFELQSEIESLRAALISTQRQLHMQKLRNEVLVEATLQAAKEAVIALGGLKIPKAPKPSAKTNELVALLHLTDWQGGKLTTSYSSEVMEQRVNTIVEKAISIAALHNVKKKCVVLLGGDMVEGLFNFPTQPFEIDSTIFTQFVTVSNLLVASVLALSAHFEQIEVIAEWGNHGRIGSVRNAIPRSDNIDRMCYHLARTLLEKNPRVKWEDSVEDIQRVEIGNYRALLIHGDEIGRNGFASKNMIVAHVNRWKSGAYPWKFQDVYCGHYHNHYEESLADGIGAVYGTGSTESDNRYAREQLAASAQPSQRLHFIDADWGRVVTQFKLWA